MFKNTFLKLTVTAVISSVLSLGLFIATAIKNVKAAQATVATDSSYLQLQGSTKQDYIREKMNCFFHMEAGTAAFPFSVPQEYNYEKMNIDGVAVEHLISKVPQTQRLILQFHGGGYVAALGNGHRSLGVLQSKLAGNAEVYYLDYRTAPQYHHPAALKDAVTLYKHLLQQGYEADNIIIIGDSAGGNLALALALYLHDQQLQLPRLLVLISPWGTLENNLPSRSLNYTKDLVLGQNTSPLVPEIAHSRYAANADLKSPYLSPLYGDMHGLPALLIQTGGYETLLDDGLLIAKKARSAGVDVQQTTYEAMPHDFALLLPQMQESADSWAEISAFINKRMP